MKKHLVISPHPDDAEIGMGPLIHKIAESEQVDIAVCTGPGDLKMVHSGKSVSFKERIKEQDNASLYLGVKNTLYLNIAPASRFDTVPQADFVSVFDALLQNYSHVYVPLPAYNKDHTVVFEAVMAAMRPGKIDQTNVYAYEQHFSNEVGPQVTGMFGKKYFDVSEKDVMEAGTALRMHRSQMVGRDRSIYGSDGLRRQAQYRGAEVGVSFATRLYVIREMVF